MTKINENSTKAEVLGAVKQNWLALCHASEALRGDKEVMLEAVKPDGEASDDIAFETMRYLAWVRH